MFDKINATQTIADCLKDMLHTNTPAQRQTNQPAYAVLTQFERSSWNPYAFQAALDAVPGFTVVERGHFVHFAYEPPNEAAAAIHRLLEKYLELTSQQTQLPGFFDVDEAARYLGMSRRAILHHYHVSKKLTGQVWHRAIVFTKQNLDAFKNIPLKRGNPTSRPRRTKTVEGYEE